MPLDDASIMIVKKKKVSGGDGHHGGAWKVAYADFVTAMMAFFLLMWLLSATSEQQRQGIADYFSPTIPLTESSSGGASLFGGDTVMAAESRTQSGTGGLSNDETLTAEGGVEQDGPRPQDPKTADPFLEAVAQARAELEFEAERRSAIEARILAELTAKDDAVAEASAGEEGALETADARAPQDAPAAGGAENDAAADAPDLAAPTPFETAADAKITNREALEKALQNPDLSSADRDAMRAAYEAIEQADENGDLLQHLAMRVTPEGLLIEIAETAKTPLFASSSAEPSAVMTALMTAIAPAIAGLENRVAIVGHTDGRPFSAGSRRNNWTLSTARADAARRLLVDAGLPTERLARISGAADRDPLTEDVLAPENRRIGLTLLRETSKRARATEPAKSGTPEASSRSNGGDAARQGI